MSLPPHVIEPPEVVRIRVGKGVHLKPPITGHHLVCPDGTIDLGPHGTVYVAGMTLEQAAAAVTDHLRAKGADKHLPRVKVSLPTVRGRYALIADVGPPGAEVRLFDLTGKETVLDAVLRGPESPGAAREFCVWILRPAARRGQAPQILPVDWQAIVEQGNQSTNYALRAGDHVYVAKPWRIGSYRGLVRSLSPTLRERLTRLLLSGGKSRDPRPAQK